MHGPSKLSFQLAVLTGNLKLELSWILKKLTHNTLDFTLKSSLFYSLSLQKFAHTTVRVKKSAEQSCILYKFPPANINSSNLKDISNKRVCGKRAHVDMYAFFTPGKSPAVLR